MHHTPEIEEAGCAHFESTLGLMDGLLAGAARAAAEQHCAACPLCGPLVADWAPLHTAFVHHFEERAELAKPDLARMPDRVLKAIDGAKAPTREASGGFFARLAALLHLTQAQLGLAAAAAAVAVIAIPLAKMDGSSPIASPSPSPSTAPVAGTGEDRGTSHVDQLAFDGASGTVYTTDDNTLVIWVTEADGA